MACSDALRDNDLAVVQGVFGDVLRTTILHSGGETMADDGIPLRGYEGAKNPMQALGSALTYARRYGLCSMLGIAPEDDDANTVAADKPSAAAYITPKDVGVLIDLCQKKAANIEALMKFYKVESMDKITTAQLPILLAQLSKKDDA